MKQCRIPSISCRWTPLPLHTRHLDHVVPSRAPEPLQSIHTWATSRDGKLPNWPNTSVIFQCWMTWIHHKNLAWNQNYDQFKWVGSEWVVVGFLPIWWGATFAKPTYQVGKKKKLLGHTSRVYVHAYEFACPFSIDQELELLWFTQLNPWPNEDWPTVFVEISTVYQSENHEGRGRKLAHWWWERPYR